MGGIRFSGCGCQSENPFVCFWRETHTKILCVRSPGEDEGRKVKETSRQKSSEVKESVKRRKHNREVDWTD